MHKVNFLILGAGPAGLTFANCLQQSGCLDFLLVEKEAECGGLCRTAMIGGTPVDIGGGHFLDVRRPKVNEFLFGFLPQEYWNRFNRDSRIDLHGCQVGHPLEANIWQLPIDEQVQYIKSIAQAGCNQGQSAPQDFVEWIRWKLGNKIAEDYMIPYNQKMFGDALRQLGTYWLEKLPNVSFEETLRSCLERKPYGTQPGHAQFYYPKKGGYGELWSRMGHAVKANSIYGHSVKTLDFDRHEIVLDNGSVLLAESIIVTVPWTSMELCGLPEDLLADVKQLKYSSVYITYYPGHLNTDAHWIYYPQPELAYHRILCLENFCDGKGYWTETNADRYHAGKETDFYNQYAYPLNTRNKPAIMQRLLTWAKQRQVYGLGRWGEWEHYNSDVVVERALALAERMR